MLVIRRSLRAPVVLAASLLSFVSFFVVSSSGQALRPEDAYREIGYVPMKDGVKLAYTVYRPTKEGRYPVLVQYDPYVSGGLDLNDSVKDYLRHGYAVVGANVRGAGCSGGTYSLFGPHEGPDGAALIEWIGAQPWSDGNVGMVGNSYPGHTQILVGAQLPRYLKALAAGGLTGDIYKEAFRPAGIFNVSFASRWAFYGQPRSSATSAENRIKLGDKECEAIRARQPSNPTFYDVRDRALHDEFWKIRATETYIDRIKIPFLIVQGWQDHQTAVSGGPRLFERLTGPKKLILQNGGHGVYRRTISRAEAIRWMDRWLKGEQNGIDKEPMVTVWFETRDLAGDSKPGWTWTFSNWPVPEAQWHTLYLTADGQLRQEKPGAEKDNGKRSYTFPSGTELVGSNAQFASPPDTSGALTYRTPAMDEDTTILGSPLLTFHASAEHKDTDFMVALHDISPSGDTLYLQRGFLRASLRAIDAARSTPHYLFRPYNKGEELIPGQIYEMKISIPPLGHVVRRGHALELVIMAPSPTPQPDWGLLPVELPGVNSVYHSSEYPSNLMLPVVPGRKAEASAPSCGTLEMQPCRPAPRTSTTAQL